MASRIRPADIPRRAAFREASFHEALALDPGAGVMAGLARGQQPAPGAFSLFFDCGNPCAFDPTAVGDDGLAILSIDGPLENRASWLWSSYEGIVEACEMAAACESVRATVLRIESPGGVAKGMSDIHRALRRLSKGPKPLFAWCQQACSAAMNIASACSEIWLPDDGEMGSVGVILCTIDESEHLKKEGIAVKYVVTGARKADGHPGQPVTADMLADAQAKVDQLGDLFFRAVAKGRGLKPAYVQALEAATFLGADAVEIGLADGVAGWTDFLDFVRASVGATVAARTVTANGETPTTRP